MKPINTKAVPTSFRANVQSSTSTAKSEANRKSALKSTGPKTLIGKRNVRLNALKHAFYAQELIIRPECKTEIETLQGDLRAPLLPKTALQQLAFKAVVYCAWHCELAARLDMRSVNALLFPPQETESSSDTNRKRLMDSWFAGSPGDYLKGIRFLDHLKLEVERLGVVPEELKDSLRKGFGPRYLELLDQPKSPIGRDALLLADHLVRHAKIFGKPLPDQPKEGPELIVDPQQSLLGTLKLIELMKDFLNDLRQINRGASVEAARLSAGNTPPSHFASATRALHRAVAWYQHLVTNNL